MSAVGSAIGLALLASTAAIADGIASPPPCGYSVEYYVAPDCGIFDVRSYGFGVNNSGVVVGKLDGCPQSGHDRAFVWWPEGLVEVINIPDSTTVRAWDVNESNQVILEMLSPVPGMGYVPAIWENGEITMLELPEWATTGKPISINDVGVVVGEYGNVVVGPYPLLSKWTADEGLVDLSDLFDVRSQTPVGISNGGMIAGSTIGAGTDWRTFVLESGVVSNLGDVPGCVNSIATSLGNSGHVVGYGHSGELPVTRPWKGFVWHDGVMSLIQPLPVEGHDEAIPHDVNSSAVLVGYSDSSGPGVERRPTIWFDGAPYDLATLVVLPPSSQVYWPRAISDSGIVAGTGSHMGAPRAFRLTPKPVSFADLNVDCQVNGADLAALLRKWGHESRGALEDINGDGVVDGSDLGLLLSEWTG